MDHPELIRHIVDYERGHAVSDYVFRGLHVWPAVRLSLGWVADPRWRGRRPPGHSTRLLRLARVLGRAALGRARPQHLVKATLARANGRPPGVICGTYVDRVQGLGGKPYHYIVDPLCELIAACGNTSAVWLLDGHGAALCGGHTACGEMVDFAAFVAAARERGTRQAGPAWYADYTRWAGRTGVPLVPWHSLAIRIRRIRGCADRFTTALSALWPHAVFVDCWYSDASLALCLACFRLGIPALDLQHGTQGVNHFAYSGWSVEPGGGYEMLPKGFWVWGQDDAQGLRANNAIFGFRPIYAGGNLWVNKWRTLPLATPLEQSRRAVDACCDGHPTVVLVALQGGEPFAELLAQAVADSPAGWLWAVRMHRNMTLDERRHALALEQRFGAEHVCVRQATELALYGWLSRSSCLVTWFSTCALEALAFGKPAVLLAQKGIESFSRYIEAGVMAACPARTSLTHAVKNACRIPAARCLAASQRVFAPAEHARQALNSVLAQASVNTHEGAS